MLEFLSGPLTSSLLPPSEFIRSIILVCWDSSLLNCISILLFRSSKAYVIPVATSSDRLIPASSVTSFFCKFLSFSVSCLSLFFLSSSSVCLTLFSKSLSFFAKESECSSLSWILLITCPP